MNSKFLLLIVLFFVSSTYACESVNTSKEKRIVSELNNSTTIDVSDNHNVKEANITFKANTIIEVAFVSLEGGKEKQIGMEYFPKILPIAAKYGGKMLGSLQVTAVTDGKIHPQMIAFFEWPNLKEREKLLKDKDAKKLFPIRDDAMTFFKQAYYTVDKDVTVTFKEGKTYEFFNAWLTPESKTALPKYFKNTDEVKKKYGPPAFLANLKPLKNGPKESYVLHPHMTGIVEWNNTNAYYGLIADPEFKKHEYLLNNSLTRIDMIHGVFNFPPQ
ncbi:hypothetical protein H3Z83_12495 [Tenacibaculum sp. S7007]|uniref:DUF1330 domain-containing protein n=1 Tax=Tenacibaculum pelagium TaxID=2759527 RepID=A0A839ASR2_9FLAO|nr:hypothetical protein [Tenacibaculum pelagium]MBA6157329.1 hypothetical protein [Tenacibaculum pelagium]